MNWLGMTRYLRSAKTCSLHWSGSGQCGTLHLWRRVTNWWNRLQCHNSFTATWFFRNQPPHFVNDWKLHSTHVRGTFSEFHAANTSHNTQIIGIPLDQYYSFRICCTMNNIIKTGCPRYYLFTELQFGSITSLVQYHYTCA
jgi:hypothetical protein